MFDILNIYQQLKSQKDWIRGSEIKKMRTLQYRLTQEEFAHLLGVSYHTYKNWEIDRYTPSTPAQALLHVARYHSEIFLKNREEVIRKIRLLS